MFRARVLVSKLLMWSENHISVYDVFDFIAHTIGSNSTGPSVVGLITFGALSWTVIVTVAILLTLLWCLAWSECKWLLCRL